MRLRKSLLALTMLVAAGVTSFAQTAEEIVAKHLTAIGGEAAWKKVNAIKFTGAINANGMEIPISMTAVNNKAMRIDFTIMGTSNYQIVTEKEGWAYMPIQQQTKPEPMTADQIKMMKDELDVQGDLVDYKAKGAKIEALGKDDVEGTEVVKLKYTDKDGQESVKYFDTEKYYLLKETKKMQVDGKEIESETSYSDYQKQPSGIVVAMAMDSDGGPMKFSSVEVNPKIDDAIFKPTTN